MKHVSILVPKGNAILSSIVGPYKIFKAANMFMTNTGRSQTPFFDIHLVGLSKETTLYEGAFSVHCNCTVHDVKKTDLIVIPAGRPEKLSEDIKENYEFVHWIRRQKEVHNAEVASLCLGAFVLAETGLVDGRQCTTHWAGMDMFRKRYPQVDLISNKVVTDEDGIYTSGGAYSFLNLMLHLVDKYCGRETAIYISKFFEIEMDRDNQHQFAIFQGQKDHEDEAIRQAQLYIEGNVSEKISVDALAEMYAISRRNFVRRFKKATQNTPLEYIQRVKVEAAKKRLESTQHNVTEVMFGVGYSDQKAFRNVFKKYAGLSPVAYKGKYNRSMVNILDSPTAW
ncbi:GlxA family transcriptional regulator [Maribacter sp. 2304DJ31-5]|uniref:GlxA family transcriptional regulator n=1 Tax=Maribacter sp. 2304DJ31-5 TaxID=3386273 RepID=UPI0039BD1F62